MTPARRVGALPAQRLFGAVGAPHVDGSLVAPARNADAPWIAADFAVLNEASRHVRLHADFDLLAAVGTDDEEGLRHSRVIAL
jgi:hypothetical protein